jgi:starch-binding outer membrane protein, SusD/RagB family
MKKIIYIITVVLLFSSCSDLLEETNRNSITESIQYSTVDGYETLVNSCYTFSRMWYGKTEGEALTDLGTDCFTAASGCNGTPLAYYSTDFQGSTPVLAYLWNGLYSALNTCNIAIKKVNDVPLSADLKAKREGEARFLRAFYLWHIVETWGEAPLYTDEINSVVTTAHHTSVDDFYKQIFSDLDIAITKLDGTAAKDNGRITKAVAQAFKARLSLYRGKYQDAIDLATAVIARPEFKMYDSFKSTFDMSNSEGTNNTEAIWWVNYTLDKNLGLTFDGQKGFWLWEGGNHSTMFSGMVYWSFPGMWVAPSVCSPNVQNMPTLAFLNMFDEMIDQRYDVTFRTAWYANDATKLGTSGLHVGDTAIVTTKYPVTTNFRSSKLYKIVDRNDVYDTNGKPAGSRQNFVSMYKFADPTRATGWEKESKRDAFVMRISEMYLIRSEAYMQLNKMSEAVTDMNTVRTKRAIAGKEAQMQVTGANMNIDFILDERAREFAGEQMRWFDLKRTGKLLERVKKYNPDAAPNIQAYHTLRPIPQSELDAITNKNEFKQNTGYK